MKALWVAAGWLAYLAPAGALAGAAAAPPSGTELTVLTPVVDLGEVEPGETPALPGRLTLMVRSSGPWQLAVRRDPATSAHELTAVPRARAAERVLVRLPDGMWQALPPGLPVALTSGSATPRGGVPLEIELSAESTFDCPPGQRLDRLRLLVNGVAAPVDARIGYAVPRHVTLAASPAVGQPATQVDPTKAGVYPLETRVYTVSSNSPWTMTVRLRSILQDARSRRGLPETTLVLLGTAGKPQPLTPGVAVPFANGPATGTGGAAVALRLGVALASGAIQGDYSAELDVVASVGDITTPGGPRPALHGGPAGDKNVTATEVLRLRQ